MATSANTNPNTNSPAPTVNTDDSIQSHWAKIRQALANIFKMILERKCPSVFERKLEEVKTQLEELEEQGNVQADCLCDVAESLEKVTLMLQGGDIKNASGKVMEAALNTLDNTSRIIENYLISHTQLEAALTTAFGEVEKDKSGNPLNNGKKVLPSLYEGEGEKRRIADNFGVYADFSKGGTPDIYVKYNNKYAKISYGESEKGGEKLKTLRIGEARLLSISEKALLTEATIDRSLSIEEALTNALIQHKGEVVAKRYQKGEEMMNEYKSISGTANNPFKWKNFECAEIDGCYCIRDASTSGMIRFGFDSAEKKFTAEYLPNTGSDFRSEAKKGKTVLEITSNGTSQKADIAAHNNAYKILSTPMAEKFFENSGVAYKQLKALFDKPVEKTNGEPVTPRNLPIFRTMENEIKKNLAATGHTDYEVTARSKKSGSEINIVAPNGDLYKLNFKKNGEIKNHLYKPYKDGHYQESIPLFKSSSKGAKEKVSRVINDEHTSGVQKNQMCILYAAIMDAADRAYSKHAELLYTALDNSTLRDINYNASVKDWAKYGLAALDVQNAQRVPEAEKLAYIIAEEIKNQTGNYPDADTIAEIKSRYNDIRAEMQEQGGLVNYYTNELASYQPEKTIIKDVGRMYEFTETEAVATYKESNVENDLDYYEPVIPENYEWEQDRDYSVPTEYEYDAEPDEEALYISEDEWERLGITDSDRITNKSSDSGTISIYEKNGKYYLEEFGIGGVAHRELTAEESREFIGRSNEEILASRAEQRLNSIKEEMRKEMSAITNEDYVDPAFADLAGNQSKDDLNRKYKPKDVSRDRD